MLAEKRSLRRFLLFYLTSTFLLVASGEYLYYLFAKNKIIEEEKYFIRSELRYFLTQNPNIPDIVKLRKLQEKHIFNIKIAIYKNNKYVYGDFKPEKIYFNNESWVQDNKVYFLLILPKNWGKIYILCSKKINRKSLLSLRKELLLFNIFAALFVSISSFVLGKIFLKPMREAIKNTEEFLDDVTHEMNTPLSIIINNIEMLEFKGIDMDETKRIKSASLRLSKLFEDLVYVKFNKEKKRNIEEVELLDFVNDRFITFSQLIESKGLKVIKELRSLKVKMDKEDLLRIIDNILSNAIKYSPQNSDIKLLLNVDESKSLVVENVGNISDLNHVTKKFFRESSKTGGLGLGLYIVERICNDYSLGLKINSNGSYVSVKVDFSSVSV